jgi:hypothetical protein
MNLEEFGRQQAWFNRCTIRNLYWMTKENREEHQDGRFPDEILTNAS